MRFTSLYIDQLQRQMNELHLGKQTPSVTAAGDDHGDQHQTPLSQPKPEALGNRTERLHGTTSKAPPMQRGRLGSEDGARRAKFHQAPGLPERDIAPDGRPSPDYVQTDDSIWNQNMLSKVLLQLKYSEVKKLTFS